MAFDKWRNLTGGRMASSEVVEQLKKVNLEKILEEQKEQTPLVLIYSGLQNVPSGRALELLKKMSLEQREAFFHLVLWQKDQLNPQRFSPWVALLENADDKTFLEFIHSAHFALYLKSRFHISTFDLEEPLYPQHENFFLTEDSLLLVEYKIKKEGEVLQEIIKRYYHLQGVEPAYQYLFKIVAESFFIMQENHYDNAQKRLEEFAWPDYFSANEKIHPFYQEKELLFFLEQKKKTPPHIIKSEEEFLTVGQSLEQFIPSGLQKEYQEVLHKNEYRYLPVNYLKLIHCLLAAKADFSQGIEQLGGISKTLNLAYEYLTEEHGVEKVFSLFTFLDLYKIGISLGKIQGQKIKKNLLHYGFTEKNEYFLGSFFSQFLENAFYEPVRLFDFQQRKSFEVLTFNDFKKLQKNTETLMALLPYIKQFYESLQSLMTSQSINSSYYLNYKVEEIDFEALLLTSYIAWELELFATSKKRMAITKKEFKDFYQRYFKDPSLFSSSVRNFVTEYGFAVSEETTAYIISLMAWEWESIDIAKMKEDEFAFLGGAIILAGS